MSSSPSSLSLSPTLVVGGATHVGAYWLAPLESVSDAAFRRLCHSLGAGFTWTEMIRARAVARRNQSTLSLIDTFDADVPTGVQLLVGNERELLDALRVLEEVSQSTHPHFKNIRAIDLNFGCPSPDVVRGGAGPALLKRQAKMTAIFEALASFKKTTSLDLRFVGAKLRLGLHGGEKSHKVVLPIVDAANATLDYVTVHGRHARQESKEPADWRAIGEARARATIPFFGNGDVFSADDAQRMRRETGCDGVLIARGAIRSPWIFRALTGQASMAQGASTAGLPTLPELEAAERAYFERALGLGSREKFIEWHREGFRRLRERITRDSSEIALPKTGQVLG